MTNWYHKFTANASLEAQYENQLEDILSKMKQSNIGLAFGNYIPLPKTVDKLKELGYEVNLLETCFFIYNYKKL